ncbi:MAG: serpin family protein [Bacilli bacterium]|nr:serpin family protein [Bacilli bacterium]
MKKKEKTIKKDNLERNRRLFIVVLLMLIILMLFGVCCYEITRKKKFEEVKVKTETKYSPYRLSSNSLENFDLYFLQLENEKKNKTYSPLSIKYALEMLEEGANGETKKQISDIIGTYSAKKYINNNNMSFANALFIKDSFKNSIKDSYASTLSNKYNAEIVYDSFKTPDVINSWVSNKTFKLINNIADDISNQDFILTNALAIDMEWVNKIQSETKPYYVNFAHEDYHKFIGSLNISSYHELEFNGFSKKAKSAEIGVVANKYDILNTLGEQNIRDNITKKYQEWLNSDNYESQSCDPGKDKDVKSYVDDYIKEINEGYKQLSSSTDFNFYSDNNVKVFAKDLKEYNGTTLQYIGIMPKNDNLDNYIKNTNSKEINNLITNLKPIELDSFKDGVITEIYGYIPMFKFDYELNLMNDLNKLGITNVFDSNKADLSNLSSSNIAINKATHKANIEFSNDGIKAAAATAVGGAGAGSCGFEYLYKVPVEKIDLSFNKPYMFLIRDKNSGEIWFTGTVYEPVEYQRQNEIEY